MITVLADDLSGAAEIGGACLEHGLAAEVQTTPRTAFVPALVLDLDVRSLPAGVAAERANSAVRALAERAGRRFCKVDSVLRGPVAGVLAGLLAATGLPRALLVPANPGRGRVIRAGQYLVEGLALSETEFARDPEHPARTADVLGLLDQAGDLPVAVIRPSQPLPVAGIIVGEAASATDLAHWAARVDAQTLPAGAAEFFGAWLTQLGHPPVDAAPPPRLGAVARALVVSGSTSAAGSQFCQQCEQRGVPVVRMPADLFSGLGGARAEARWEANTRQALAAHPLVVVAIDQPPHPAPHWPERLRAALAGLVASVLASGQVGRLYIEGGATARAIIDRLGWRRLRVCGQLAPGVVAVLPVGVAGPQVVLKPGSYAWRLLDDFEGVSNVPSASA